MEVPFGADSVPMSLSELRASGALDPSTKGINALILVANRGENDRPHWGKIRTVATATDDAVATAKKAQQYLIDLGDALVAEGMLSK